MLKRFAILFLILGACNSQPISAKSPYQFYHTHLLFDLDKEVERNPCKVQGTIPTWLSGTLLRNGPAKFSVGGEKRVNWFDGLAMLHAFEFTPQEVLYSNRFLRCEQYYIMVKEKSLDFSGFAQDPCPVVFKNQTSRFIPKEMKNIESASVTIQEYADMMVALTESPLPVVFDPKTLDTIGNFEYNDKLPKSQIWESAHAQHDLAAGETFNYLIEFGPQSSYVIWKMRDHLAVREVVNKIPVDLPAYMHSFALTEHYIILVEFPFVVNPMDLIHRTKPFIFNYTWKPERGTTFYVTERSTGKLVAKIKDDPFFAFHHVNAYDEQGKIFIDIVTEPNADIIGVITETVTDKKKILESGKTKLQRFTIDMSTQALSKETIFNDRLEMPRVPADRTAHEYQYCYAIDAEFPNSVNDVRPLYKIDVNAKTSQKWAKAGCFPGEPIFVPRPEAQDEDDGVVLSVVLDLVNNTSFLLILDAHTMQELGRAEAPHAIPVGLHGLWNQF
jgi:beta,beta-carotene 9',10'-dioxygenase